MLRKFLFLSACVFSSYIYADGSEYKITTSILEQESVSARVGLEWKPAKPISMLKFLGNSHGIEYGHKSIDGKDAHEFNLFSKLSFDAQGTTAYYKGTMSTLKLPSGSSQNSVSSLELEYGLKLQGENVSFEIGQGIRIINKDDYIFQVGDKFFTDRITMYPSLRTSFRL